MTNQLYLKTRKRTIPIEVTLTEVGLLVQGEQINFEIVGLDLVNFAAPPLPARQAVNVLEMTPLDVVNYFAASPALYIYADDLRSAFKLSSQDGSGNDLQHDIQAVQHLKQPSLADISEALTGSRQYGGATYTRVKAVKEALNSTTTPKNWPEKPVETQKAA